MALSTIKKSAELDADGTVDSTLSMPLDELD
jgi:hypothetical protein